MKKRNTRITTYTVSVYTDGKIVNPRRMQALIADAIGQYIKSHKFPHATETAPVLHIQVETPNNGAGVFMTAYYNGLPHTNNTGAYIDNKDSWKPDEP